MADQKNDSKQTEKTRQDPRAPLREARERRLKLIAGDRASMIKVFPANDDARRLMRHPVGMVGFLDGLESADWPNDSFTTRRIADGSVYTEGNSPQSISDDPKMGVRERAAARRAKPQQQQQEQPQPQPQPAKGESRGESVKSGSRPTPTEPAPAA